MIGIVHTSSGLVKLRESGRVVRLVHNELKKIIAPGVTTLELEEVAEEIIAKEGGVPSFKGYRGFPHSICASINEEIVHGFPSNRKLNHGDVLTIDVGVFKEGYHGDAAFMELVGCPISVDDVSLVLASRICLNKAIEHLKEGVTLGSVGNIIESNAKFFGFDVVKNYCGHFIGKELHEIPQVLNFGRDEEGLVLKSGMCLCIEPMLVSNDAANHRLEDGWTVVTDNGNKASHVEAQVIIHKDHCEVIAG